MIQLWIGILIRRIAGGVALAVVGFIFTPVGIVLAGEVLFAHRRFSEAAQGFGSGLTFVGMLLAPAGALYWFVAGILLARRDPDVWARGSRRIEYRRDRVMGATIAVWIACLIGAALFFGWSYQQRTSMPNSPSATPR
jgi:hypothetical protein